MKTSLSIAATEPGPPSRTVREEGGHSFVARQPIFDRNMRVYAYEWLFRASEGSEAYDAPDGNTATSTVIAHTLFVFGIKDIPGDRPGFFNFTRDHLLADYSGILDPRNTVIEVLESVAPDEEVTEACRRLKAKGYKLALDDFLPASIASPLADLADIIKVDFRQTSEADRRSLARHFRARGVIMLAEKVETSQEFALAREWGYTLFQGYFFARPEIIGGRRIPETKKQYHTLLCALNRPDFDFAEIESAIKLDPSLTYKFLLFVNSANFGFLSRIHSFRQALMLLGEQQVRTWISVAVVASLGADKPPELIITGGVRARFCQSLGAKARLAAQPDSLFVLGLFSVMDAIMGMPLAKVLSGLRIDGDVVDALLEKADPANRMASIYGLVRAYELGDWQTVADAARTLRIQPDAIGPLYMDALQWATRVFAAEPR